jgi:signal transduction histidine kinase/CheY-like chemotaxis protein
MDRDVTTKTEILKSLESTNQQIRTLLENIPGVVYKVSSDGSLEFYSSESATIDFINTDLIMEIGDWYRLVHPEDVERVKESFSGSGILSSKSAIEYRICLNSEVEVYLADRKTVSNDENGDFSSAKGILFDITQQKTLEFETKKIERQMFVAAKMASLGVLAAGVGHEINNPLAIIFGSMEAGLEEVDQDSKQMEGVFRYALDAAKRIREVVNNLTVFAGGERSGSSAVDLSRTLYETVAFVRGIFAKENILMDLNVEAGDFTVKGDAGELRQVFLNILNNARAGMRDEGGVIQIRLVSSSKGVRVEFHDNGEGIREENLDRIFDSFFTTREVGQGVGLGLSIVHHIVKSMDGEVSAESEYGLGTNIAVDLPLFEVQAEEDGDESCKYEKLSGRALLVEDEVAVRTLIARYLKGFGVEVDEAKDGQEALRKISQNEYDCVITDLKMPGMGGEEFIESVRGSFDIDKIIVITGYGHYGLKEKEKKIFQEFAHSLLKKPFRQKRLFKLVRSKLVR